MVHGQYSLMSLQNGQSPKYVQSKWSKQVRTLNKFLVILSRLDGFFRHSNTPNIFVLRNSACKYSSGLPRSYSDLHLQTKGLFFHLLDYLTAELFRDKLSNEENYGAQGRKGSFRTFKRNLVKITFSYLIRWFFIKCGLCYFAFKSLEFM